MSHTLKFRNTANIFFIAFLLLASNKVNHIFAQSNNQNSQLPIVTEKDYDQFEYLGAYNFSNDGKWLYYATSTQGQDKTVFIKNIKTGKVKEISNAERVNFSNNSLWFAYTKTLTGEKAKEEKRKAVKDKKHKNKTAKIGLVNLKTNDTIELENVKNYKFSGTSSYIAMKRVEGKMNTVVVKDLTTNSEISFGNVSEYSWQDKGLLLALVIKTKDSVGNAIQLYNPKTGTLKVLDHKKAVYQNLKWRKESDDLFAARTVKNENYEENNSYDLLVWKGLSSNNETLTIFDQSKFKNFPKDTRILLGGRNRVTMSKDWNAIYFSTFGWEPKIKEEKKVKEKNDSIKDVSEFDEAPAVEIWNSKDLVIIPAQKKSAMADLASPKVAVWKIDANKFVLLEDELTENVKVQVENKIVLGLDRTPYDFEAMFGRTNYDVYTVNTNTGAKKKVLSKINKVYGVSPNNQYFVYLNNNNLHLFNIKKETSVNITKDLDGSFIMEDDHPLPQKAAHGFGKWTKDSSSFIINSEFDVWQVFTNGSMSRNITNGKNSEIAYRYLNFDWEELYIDMTKPMYFTMKGKWTKESGVAHGTPGKKIKTLIYKNASISRPLKAKNNDLFLFKEESYTQSPNLFLANATFKSPKQLSNTNKFQKDFAWGKAVLVDYVNTQGNKTQGILYYPANFEEGKKYPMITYIYEKLTQGLHRYSAPSRTNYYSTTVWSQNGYFVFKPDIEFTEGEPGISSTKNLELAVSAVVERGDVDAKRVGLIGHSWGGYQAGYVPTQTDIFAATVAGAGLTELISMNLAVTPAFGGRPENDHFEVGQERMGSAPWVSPDNYVRNSSVMQIDKLNTPILFEVGDNDQNVNWSQGVAYYNAARRANKPFVLLVYAKEGHGLRNDKNKIDYQQRILKWFGHFLKGEEAEDWVLKGIPYAEQQKRLKNW